MKFCLVHGFNVRDGGTGTVDRLAPFLAGDVDTDEADYGWVGLIGVRLRRKKLTRRISRALHGVDAVVTHSNGAAYAIEALWAADLPPNSVKLIHFSPALDRDVTLPPSVSEQHCFHTTGDFWCKVARWLPFHPWGAAGAYGIRESYGTRTYNHDYSHKVDSHSGWFEGVNAAYFAQCVNEIANNPL